MKTIPLFAFYKSMSVLYAFNLWYFGHVKFSTGTSVKFVQFPGSRRKTYVASELFCVEMSKKNNGLQWPTLRSLHVKIDKKWIKRHPRTEYKRIRNCCPTFSSEESRSTQSAPTLIFSGKKKNKPNSELEMKAESTSEAEINATKPRPAPPSFASGVVSSVSGFVDHRAIISGWSPSNTPAWFLTHLPVVTMASFNWGLGNSCDITANEYIVPAWRNKL